MTNPEHKIADALRVVALRLENALEEGRRSTRIDANDLLAPRQVVPVEPLPERPVGRQPVVNQRMPMHDR